MKEAAGEANLTVIAIILIAVVAAVVTPIINSTMTTSAKKTCCSNAGGTWRGSACFETLPSGAIANQAMTEATYWNENDRTCQ